MANETMVLLEKIVVPSGGASSVTFTNIPQSYTDLVVKLSLRKSDSNTLSWSNMTFNNSSSGYSATRLYGNGAGAASDTNPDVGTSSLYIGSSNSATSTGNTFSNFEVYIPNYTSSNNKSVSVDSVQEDNASSAYQFLVAGLWSNSAAITRIDISGFANYVQYSTFYLYGVAKQGVTPTNAPAATGGDRILFDGTYWYHVFTSTGAFTPKKNLTGDVLVVAGGGGADGNISGGGGAGGLRLLANQTLSSATTVTVGAGGTGGAANYSTFATNGINTSFGSIAVTGGGNGRYGGANAGNGGSGGGSRAMTAGTGNAGSYSPPEGTNGAVNSNTVQGGGGGGAGSAAAAGGGTGGDGANSYNSISFSAWLSATSTGVGGYLAGGGGGSRAFSSSTYAGGLGGGGTGAADNTAGGAGAPNTGSGGGGGGYANPTAGAGGAGGSGIVIVRYAA